MLLLKNDMENDIVENDMENDIHGKLYSKEHEIHFGVISSEHHQLEISNNNAIFVPTSMDIILVMVRTIVINNQH